MLEMLPYSKTNNILRRKSRKTPDKNEKLNVFIYTNTSRFFRSVAAKFYKSLKTRENKKASFFNSLIRQYLSERRLYWATKLGETSVPPLPNSACVFKHSRSPHKCP